MEKRAAQKYKKPNPIIAISSLFLYFRTLLLSILQKKGKIFYTFDEVKKHQKIHNISTFIYNVKENTVGHVN